MLLFEIMSLGDGKFTLNSGIFGGGYNYSVGPYLSTTDKYTYSGDSVVAGTNLSAARGYLAAAGTSTVGIFAQGSNNSTYFTVSDKYTYSGDSVTSGTSLGTTRNELAGTGTSTVGIFAGGYNNGTYYSVSDKYTYSGDSVVAGTNLSAARYLLAAAGTSTVGIFAGGSTGSGYPTGTYKYTYSGDSVTSGSSLTLGRQGLAGTGTSTFGLFGGGYYNISTNLYYTNVVDKYTYSGDSVTSGTSLGANTPYLGATGSSTVGIFGGGGDPPGIVAKNVTAITYKYTYSGDSLITGTNLTTARSILSAPGSTPASFI